MFSSSDVNFTYKSLFWTDTQQEMVYTPWRCCPANRFLDCPKNRPREIRKGNGLRFHSARIAARARYRPSWSIIMKCARNVNIHINSKDAPILNLVACQWGMSRKIATETSSFTCRSESMIDMNLMDKRGLCWVEPCSQTPRKHHTTTSSVKIEIKSHVHSHCPHILLT